MTDSSHHFQKQFPLSRSDPSQNLLIDEDGQPVLLPQLSLAIFRGLAETNYLIEVAMMNNDTSMYPNAASALQLLQTNFRLAVDSPNLQLSSDSVAKVLEPLVELPTSPNPNASGFHVAFRPLFIMKLCCFKAMKDLKMSDQQRLLQAQCNLGEQALFRDFGVLYEESDAIKMSELLEAFSCCPMCAQQSQKKKLEILTNQLNHLQKQLDLPRVLCLLQFFPHPLHHS
eukprot:c493_g1_i1.p1 GENE.c493_g1_i1~~c493_g1_i1.p1  ORF type:complete len:228 (-),score=40.83 c493_g1_i1:35-718(-)